MQGSVEKKRKQWWKNSKNKTYLKNKKEM